MKTLKKKAPLSLIVCVMLSLLPMNLLAAKPNTKDLDAAIKTGNFEAYFTNLSAWLNQKTPAEASKITEAGMKALLKDPVFANALAQRQLIAKLGVDKAGAFVRASGTHQGFRDWIMQDTADGDYHYFSLPGTFMDWLLQNTEAMNLCLLSGAAPSDKSLETWRRIINADQESKEGIYLKLAIATSLSGVSGGSHWTETPTDPVHRYEQFKSAHKNKELFPIFDTLSVWEYRTIVSSWASDRELVWARNMLNTWRPDLRTNQQVHRVVSEVWRRNSPFSYGHGGFVTVLAGGGKCGGRSWFGAMICEAFGVPAVGVGSPGHACMAYKAADGQWKTSYAPAWEKCKVEGVRGPEFLAQMDARSHVVEFSQVERLKWIAATLTSKERADAVMAIARKIQVSASKLKPVRIVALPKTPSKSEPPFKAVPGVIHIEAETFTKSSKGLVHIYECFTGGKQVNFQKNIAESWIEYALDVPASGVYGLKMKIAAPNYKQVLNISSGKDKLATIKIPNTTGLWRTTREVEVRLNKGAQTLRVSAPYQRGVAVRWLELKSK